MPEPAPVLLMTYALGIGGSERQMVEMAKTLDRDRFRPHVGSFHPTGMRAGDLHSAGVPILDLPVTSLASFGAAKWAIHLMRYIHRNHIALVHTFDVPMNLFGAPAAWLSRRPVVLTSQRASRLLTPGIYHKLLRVTDHLADGIVVNCEAMRQHLLQDEKVPERMIHLCYNGLDTEVFQPEGPMAGRLGAATVIGVVCALRKEKGLGTLVAGFAEVAKEQTDVRLLIVGSGPELPGLQAQAQELGISDRCSFVPAADEVAPWLRAIDIFVLPSLSEAFSNSLMEAMACGCCPVASNVGGNPELAGDPGRGVLFEAGDAAGLARILKDLLANPERRKALAAESSRWLRKEFSVAAAAKRLGRIYSSHLADKK